MKILHVLDHSLPTVDGYSIRSHNILSHQKQCGLDVLAVTSPKQEGASGDGEEFDGIRFWRTLENPRKSGLASLPFINEILLMRRLRTRLHAVASREKIDLIHAHSPSLNGNPARAVARSLGIPVVYEMRSIWEEYPVDHRPTLFERLRYFAGRQVETRLFRNVDAVFTICKGLQDEIIARGIPTEKTFVFPNGVDVKKFSPRIPNENLRQRLGLQGKFVVAYIGSLSHWEGLEVLLRALTLVAKRRPEVHTLLVGKDDGDQYKSLASKLNVLSNMTFVGSVKPEEVIDYYSVVDLCVYPRKRMRLTELVTPLKPLEAMALGKFVLASDVVATPVRMLPVAAVDSCNAIQ